MNSSVKPIDLVLGAKDSANEVVEAIYHQSRRFTVYRTKHSVYVEMDEDDDRIDELRKQHQLISKDLAIIYSWMPSYLSDSNEPISREVGRAIAANLMGSTDVAKELIAHAITRYLRLRELRARLIYILSSISTVAFIGLMLLIFSVVTPYTIASDPPLLELLTISLFGAMGGLMSISTSFKRLEVEPDADTLTNCLIGISRIFLSISGAILAYFAYKSGIAFSFFTSSTEKFGIYTIAIASGFSERFVPSIVNTIEPKGEPVKSKK